MKGEVEKSRSALLVVAGGTEQLGASAAQRMEEEDNNGHGIIVFIPVQHHTWFLVCVNIYFGSYLSRLKLLHKIYMRAACMNPLNAYICLGGSIVRFLPAGDRSTMHATNLSTQLTITWLINKNLIDKYFFLKGAEIGGNVFGSQEHLFPVFKLHFKNILDVKKICKQTSHVHLDIL